MVLYAWEVPDRLGAEHIAHLVFVFEDGGQIEPHEYQITLYPFTISELRVRLELAGLTEVDTDFDESRDRYAVVTVTTWANAKSATRPCAGRRQKLVLQLRATTATVT